MATYLLQKNICKKYLIQRYKRIRSHSRDYIKTGNPESLHQFRVEFKRLKAVTALISYCHPDFKAGKAYRKLKQIVQQSGEGRDYDVLQELIRKNNITAAAARQEAAAKIHRKNVKQICRKIASADSLFKAAKKKALKGAGYVNTPCIAGFLADLQNSISGSYTGTDPEAYLHEVRKQIKQLSYIAALHPGILSPQTLDRYDRLQQLIGNRRDKLMLAAYLKEQQPELSKTIQRLQKASDRTLATIRKALAGLQQ